MVELRRFGTVLAVCLLFVAGCSGENKPSEAQLREALVLEVPSYVTVIDFSVDAMENTGNEVEPNYIARFNAKVESNEALYARDGAEGDVLFLLDKTAAGTVLDLFGKSSSQLYQGEWRHDLYVEGNTLSALGRPLAEFADRTTIVRGSAEETAHYAQLKAADAEFDATVAGLPLHDLITDYYDTKGEFRGQFAIHEVLASRAEKKTNEQFQVHAKYSYRRAKASEAVGEDRRVFTVRKLEGQWQVVAMGSARSGRIQ